LCEDCHPEERSERRISFIFNFVRFFATLRMTSLGFHIVSRNTPEVGRHWEREEEKNSSDESSSNVGNSSDELKEKIKNVE